MVKISERTHTHTKPYNNGTKLYDLPAKSRELVNELQRGRVCSRQTENIVERCKIGDM